MKLSQIKLKKIPLYIKMVISNRNPIKNILGSILVLSGLSKYIVINLNSYKIRFFPTTISLSYFISKGVRKSDESVLEKFLKTGDKYIDVGANIGALALKASTLVGTTGRVVAIEAHPKTYLYLTENIKLNGFVNIDAINFAVGERNGFLVFSDIGSDDENYVKNDANGLQVMVKRLDDIIDFSKIDFLKIDVEGYELFVLKGAERLLKNTEIIFIEMFDKNFERYGYSSSSILNLIHSYGFTCYNVNENYARIDDSYINRKVENIICLKDANYFK